MLLQIDAGRDVPVEMRVDLEAQLTADGLAQPLGHGDGGQVTIAGAGEQEVVGGIGDKKGPVVLHVMGKMAGDTVRQLEGEVHLVLDLCGGNLDPRPDRALIG